ncbi:hypothetical protein J7I98_07415 [Streptomyces sp. ISL-98]|uniref:hypothetical protein n=1 Tax=Streptomyces sp. ISL-98 TaxID=2819192 RepID=UPI001BE4FD50|nr:hypothetical protein [Streptomyces sp. ISL-98]MBT2505735.1 hypothetical protein [Streptomyces sp. ISL-98]
MSTARYLATIDLLRARAFPAACGRSEHGTSGPGFHIAELDTSEDFWEDDGTRREDVAAQFEAECEALAVLLSGRWGQPQQFSLWSLLARGFDGEDIPDPWNGLSNSVPYVYIWQVDGHWIALGVSHWDKELPFQLVAVVTETDPP